MKKGCVYDKGNECGVLICKQCEKNGCCSFFQDAKTRDKGRREWAERIAAMGMTQRKRYSAMYYGGRLEQYAEEIISKAN